MKKRQREKILKRAGEKLYGVKYDLTTLERRVFEDERGRLVKLIENVMTTERITGVKEPL